MRKGHRRPDWLQTARDALASGAKVAPDRITTVTWDVAGKCQSPIYRELTGRTPDPKLKPWNEIQRSSSDVSIMELDTRCRKCGPCLKARAAHWRMRAESELSATEGRTWFGTLTLSPEQHNRMLMQAHLRLARAGVDFDRLNSDEQFLERMQELNREITLWLKRVRKESGLPLRYLLVAEAHKSGLPHLHVLVHEVSVSQPLRARLLREQWRLGFSRFKLVAQGEERRHAAYVCKYLTKMAASRVRASQGYGHSTASERAPVRDRSLGPCKRRENDVTTPDATTREEEHKFQTSTAGAIGAFQ